MYVASRILWNSSRREIVGRDLNDLDLTQSHAGILSDVTGPDTGQEKADQAALPSSAWPDGRPPRCCGRRAEHRVRSGPDSRVLEPWSRREAACGRWSRVLKAWRIRASRLRASARYASTATSTVTLVFSGLAALDLLWPRRGTGSGRPGCRGGDTPQASRRTPAPGRKVAGLSPGVFQLEAVLFGLIPLARPSALAEVLAVDLSADPFRAVATAESPVGSVFAVAGVAGKKRKAAQGLPLQLRLYWDR